MKLVSSTAKKFILRQSVCKACVLIHHIILPPKYAPERRNWDLTVSVFPDVIFDKTSCISLLSTLAQGTGHFKKELVEIQKTGPCLVLSANSRFVQK